MIKKLTFLLLTAMFMTTVMAQSYPKAFRNQINEEATGTKPRFNRNGIVETTILSEDFSKFTAGSETEPDATRLDDLMTGAIDDEYFSVPGWKGSEIYQANGCAYIGYSEYYGEPGLLITPLINTSGAIYINCRVRCEDPTGDVIGYNIIGKDMELIDANVNFFTATGEWTEISWFTTVGMEDTYVYIFPYSKNVFIDDIEIISQSLPAPQILDETNIGSDRFTANWESVEEANAYLFKLTAEHTAEADETFYYTNTDFSDVESYGTIESPEFVDKMETFVGGWYIFLPALINEAIGITGKYASQEVFGAIASPVLDLSSDNGKVTISFKAHADLNEEIFVSLINSEYGYYDVAESKSVVVEKEGWNEYIFNFTHGTNDSYIEITNFGYGNVFIDDLKFYQTIKEGDTKSLVINELEVSDTHYEATIDERFINDALYYQVAARKYLYSDPDNEIEIGYIDSKYTEARNVTLNDNPQEKETIAIGEGEIISYYAPISNYGTAGFSISQQIYLKEEIGKESGSITSISFRNNLGNSNTRKIVVYMSNTSQQDYRDNHDWVKVNESEIVYEGEFTLGAQGEWSTIELQKAFAYTGGNISLTVYDQSDAALGYSGYDSFYGTESNTLRGLYKSASTKINVYNLEEVYGYELKTSMYSTPASTYYTNNIKFEIEPLNVEYPSVPQNISANAISESSISLTWTSAKNATSYNVYRGDEKLVNVTTTSCLAEGLDSDTQYCFSVTAVNGELESEKSEVACAKTKEEIIIPDVPANVVATAESTSSISLTWDAVENATSYNVYRGNEKIANVTAATYTDNGLEYDTEYCYNVTSVNKNNESEKSADVCVKTKGESISEFTDSFSIYPSLINNKINITSENIIEGVTIYNVTGIVVYNEEFMLNEIQLDVTTLNSGIYFVEVKSANGEVVKRIVKK